MLRGTLVVGLWTLLSRLLGMFRDIATAATLGMSVGGIMDSFVVAFRLPDIARKMLGDGSLGISYLPVFAKTWQTDRQKAWTLLSVTLAWFFFALTAFVLFGEILCWIGFSYFPPESKVFLISHFLALLLPYLILIGLAAITTASLQTIGKFSLPAMIPSILNIVWLLAILVIAPAISSEPAMQCYVLTICIVLAGVMQFFVCLPKLRSFGFKLDFHFSLVRNEIRQIFSGFFPQLFGLMSISINLLTASTLAWLFSGPDGGQIRWLGRILDFPLRAGAASAIYYSERLFEFPMGLIGLAVATVIYPLLSRHASQRNFKAFGEDLSIGMRIQFAFSIPSSVGLMLFSDRLAHLLFLRGAFTPMDSFRTADMIFWFGCGVWAFCALPVVVRAFYVLGDIRTPCRVGLLSCFFNLASGFILIWFMQEQGLALSISLSAVLQFLLLFRLFSIKHGYVNFFSIIKCIVRSCCATVLMALVIAIVMKMLPGEDSISDILHIILGGGIGVFVYLMFLRAFGGRELSILVRGTTTKKHRRRKTVRKYRK